jgi:hypothetical protein
MHVNTRTHLHTKTYTLNTHTHTPTHIQHTHTLSLTHKNIRTHTRLDEPFGVSTAGLYLEQRVSMFRTIETRVQQNDGTTAYEYSEAWVERPQGGMLDYSDCCFNNTCEIGTIVSFSNRTHALTRLHLCSHPHMKAHAYKQACAHTRHINMHR